MKHQNHSIFELIVACFVWVVTYVLVLIIKPAKRQGLTPRVYEYKKNKSAVSKFLLYK